MGGKKGREIKKQKGNKRRREEENEKKKKGSESTALRYIKRGGVPFSLALTASSISITHRYLTQVQVSSIDTGTKEGGGCRRRALS